MEAVCRFMLVSVCGVWQGSWQADILRFPSSPTWHQLDMFEFHANVILHREGKDVGSWPGQFHFPL
jgi:hypothetical protein